MGRGSRDADRKAPGRNGTAVMFRIHPSTALTDYKEAM